MPRVSPSCWLWVVVDTADRIFRAEQSYVPLICGIRAIPACVVIRTISVGAAGPRIKIVGFAYHSRWGL